MGREAREVKRSPEPEVFVFVLGFVAGVLVTVLVTVILDSLS